MPQIKNILFDLDGVLVDSRGIHANTFCMAVNEIFPDIVISKAEHTSLLDGLPTKKKIVIIAEKYGKHILEKESAIITLKNKYTDNAIRHFIKNDDRLCCVLDSLCNQGFKMFCCSNAITKTVSELLNRLGIKLFFEDYAGNEGVKYPKPHPQIYLQMMAKHGLVPAECLIVEDSPVGRQSALATGCPTMFVDKPEDITVESVLAIVNKENYYYENPELTVLIPCAGGGRRFKEAGYTHPKWLIDVNGKPMLQVVVESLKIKANYIYVFLREDYERYSPQYLLNLLTPGCKIVVVDKLTEGAACTCLLAEDYIDDENAPILIVNSDQYIEWNPHQFFAAVSHHDGGILTFFADHPKWSYVKVDRNGLISEVAEKQVISNNATVGVYVVKKAHMFFDAAREMIRENKRVNGEFYVAPSFNELINRGFEFIPYRVAKMYGLGTPEDLNKFLGQFK